MGVSKIIVWKGVSTLMKSFLFSIVIKQKYEGNPCPNWFYKWGFRLYFGVQKEYIYWKWMKSFFAQPYLKIVNIRGTHAHICFWKVVSKVTRFSCFCDLHHNVKYFFFICDRFFGKQLNFIYVCTSHMLCDRWMDLTCQV